MRSTAPMMSSTVQLQLPAAAVDAGLNLLSTVVPIVLKHCAAPPVAMVGLVFGHLLRRRRRPSS